MFKQIMFIFSCLNLGDLNSDRYASKMVSKSKKNYFCRQISLVIYENLNFATKEAAAMLYVVSWYMRGILFRNPTRFVSALSCRLLWSLTERTNLGNHDNLWTKLTRYSWENSELENATNLRLEWIVQWRDRRTEMVEFLVLNIHKSVMKAKEPTWTLTLFRALSLHQRKSFDG